DPEGLDQAGRIVSLAALDVRLGQHADAPMGPVADVPESRLPLSERRTHMCGIAGQFNYARNERVDPDVIRRMTDSIVHRGPDDEGYLVSGSHGFSFRRLSIIDLAGGHQPMADADETVWIVFNGEIYNFKELRAELVQRGHRFQTRSD